MTTITAADEKAAIDLAPPWVFVGGTWRDSTGGTTFVVSDPATEADLAQVADGQRDDAVAALGAAHEAQAGWAATPPRERGELLRRAYQALMDGIDGFALLMTLEMGKPLADSRAEVAYAADFLRWFSEEAVRLDGRYTVAPDGGSRLLVMHQPVGPCLFITPWNFPLAMATRKIAPALAAGCTCVVKPAQLTPLSMLAFAKVLEDAGLPPGVVNVVPATRASTVTGPLLDDERLRKLSFTGSTEVGRKLAEQGASRLLRISMELGGNAPFLVFEDADVDAAIDGAVVAKTRNGGEACTAANRFHVHASVAERFVDGLADRMGALKVGRGTEEGIGLGPLISKEQRDIVDELTTDAVDRGARVVLEGGPSEGPGLFYRPVVLAEVPSDARCLHEEIFGPVAPVTTFETDDEAIEVANGTEYGLVAYAYTADLERALRLTESLEVGMLGLNRGLVSNAAAPFGGVKQSGFGREGGHEGIHEYLNPRYVAIAPPS